MPERIRIVAWAEDGTIYDIWEFDVRKNKDGRYNSWFNQAMDHHFASIDSGKAVKLEITEVPKCESQLN